MKYLNLVLICFVLSCNPKKKQSQKKDINNVADTEIIQSSEALVFFNNLKKLCGKSFEGRLITPKNDEQFGGKRLVMHVRICDEDTIKIPFFVGDDKSRTWILTLKNNRISLKHDHRHKDGTDDEITMYGGITTNSGQVNIQAFSADEETKKMIPDASTNLWWITLDDNAFTYNLRRLGTDRLFTVSFDLNTIIENPDAPWGWKN